MDYSDASIQAFRLDKAEWKKNPRRIAERMVVKAITLQPDRPANRKRLSEDDFKCVECDEGMLYLLVLL